MILFNYAYLAPTLRYKTLGPQLFLFYQLIFAVLGVPHCQRHLVGLRKHKPVFRNGEEASSFLGRHLLYNQFDFEMFVPGNLERECYEEQCNYEEAREIFEDQDATMTFWKEYSRASHSNAVVKIDVVGLLTGLITAGTFLVILGLLGYYWYTVHCHPRRRSQISEEGHEYRLTTIRSRTDELLPMQPFTPPPAEIGPPTYEQAVALNTALELPPPPYPGKEINKKVYRKCFSIPASHNF